MNLIVGKDQLMRRGPVALSPGVSQDGLDIDIKKSN